MEITLLTVVIGLAVGLALGLTGAGGSSFAIPLLIVLLHVPPLEAITISLIAVTIMGGVGAISSARAQLIEYRAGLIFAVGGFVGAPLGVKFASYLPEDWLLYSLAVVLVVIAVLMWQRAGNVAMREFAVAGEGGALCRLAGDTHLRLGTPCAAVLCLCGVGIGVLSGLFGVGGGFAIVPALIMITRMSVHRAVATSMFVITLVASVALLSALLAGRQLPVNTTVLFIGGGVVGTLLGRQLTKYLGGSNLQRAFAVVLLATGGLLFVHP